MTEHARFAPSGAHRWLRCLGSVDLEAQFPDTSSAYAEEGTEAHRIASEWLLTLTPPEAGHPGFGEVDPEMWDFVKVYVDNVMKAGEGKTMLIEQKIDFSHVVGIPDQFGTADVVILGDDTLEIHDLKYGMGVPVVAKENEQLGIYALGALKQYDVFGNFKKVKLVIHMPRLEYVSEWEVELDQLAIFAGKVKEATDRIRAGNAPFNPGEKQCRFCKAKHGCEALKMSVYETVGAGFDVVGGEPMVLDNPKTIDAAGLSSRMALVGLVEDWCKAVRAAVEIELLAGRPVEGWKLVEGRMGNRKWADEKAIEATLKSMRLKVEDMYDLKLISPTTAEKLAKKKVIGPTQWEKLQKQITRSPGAPSVAPATSERSAISMVAVADDFDVVDEPKT
ncbi:MAG: DUF2800 domain-containing protein [Aestuariivirga sp.]